MRKHFKYLQLSFCYLAELLDESSDDEPLINILEKNRSDKRTKNKTKTSPQKRETPKKSRNKTGKYSSSTLSQYLCQ